ncbi:MAG: hypothetical protein M1813_004771 [Trichoglossum hirsutum]|nr:MAG: hypothetical protein M1813_004771 [Trichoglossum hirsutum]
MEQLSNELLRVILDHINQDPEASLTIDRRAHLSVESFKAHSPPERAKAQDIAQFRLVCKRFAELGISYQFTCVPLRFNRKSFHRLDLIAQQPSLSKHVKKFIYLIPYFYVEGRVGVDGVVLPSTVISEPSYYVRKYRDQRELIESGDDVRILKKAMVAFTSLQQVQIQPVQDEKESQLLETIKETDESFGDTYLDLKWSPACLHGSRTLAQALVEARSKFTVFSGLSMSPQSAVYLKHYPEKTISTTISLLASQLTCLELHFNDGADRGWHKTTIDHKMRELSGLFKEVFTAATGMRSVHVGFRPRAPLGLPLEDIFHHVTWERLRAFGIQSWFLDAEEIVQLACRHRRTLKGLRLRDVHLRKGSMWKDVLGRLRDQMEALDWLSLRRIGYEEWYNTQYRDTMEVPPDPPAGTSDSDNEGLIYETEGSDVEADNGNDDEELSDDEHDNENYDDGPDDEGLGMGPDTPSSVPWCNCGRGAPESADELGDNGKHVDYAKRKMWEQWVVGRCIEHNTSRPLPR